MGLQLHCAVARVDGDTAEQILVFVRGTRFIQARRITEPFAGIVAGYDATAAQETVYEEQIAAGVNEDDASEAGADAFWNGLDPLVAAFPHVRFAIIRVDCFGGTCRYDGHTTGPGEHVQVASSHDAHQRLLAALGAVDPPWYFAPFTRGFFERGAPPPGPQRRQVRCWISGTLRDAPLVGVALLAPPWRVANASERHAILVHGDDDLHLSLNVVGDALDLRVSSHLEPEPTAARIAELVEMLAARGELVLRDAGGAVVRQWTV
jgi:hypothetical protein